MAATLTPIFCDCSKLVGYAIRAGAEHRSAETHDPYTVSGLILREAGGWVIGPLSGNLYPGWLSDLRAALKCSGVRAVRWRRASGKETVEVIAKGESKWS